MKTAHDVEKVILELKSEVAPLGWAGLAWECLRRNTRYQSAVRRVSIGRIKTDDVSAEFGIREIKHPTERFNECKPPIFDSVRFIAPGNQRIHRSLSLRERRVSLREKQIALVVSLDQDLEVQWRAARSALAEAREAALVYDKKGCRNLRPFLRMVDLVARSLVALDLADQYELGPTQIGRMMFPQMSVASAKTKARDLIWRGERYANLGYGRFALEGALAASEGSDGDAGAKAPVTSPAVSLPSTPRLEPREEYLFLTVEPLPRR